MQWLKLAIVIISAAFFEFDMSRARIVSAGSETTPPQAATWLSSPRALYYSNDFESAVGSEWSNATVSHTPIGNRGFLGEFGNEHVQLTLGNLPIHDSATVTFDLFIIRSWDGNSSPPYGPDTMDLSLGGGPSLMHATFENCDYPCPWGQPQSYPDNYPGGSHPPYTGAAEIETLGYYYVADARSAVYHLSYYFSHTTSSLVLDFSGSNLESLANESWGLDNVQVSLGGEPPSSISGYVGSACAGGIYKAIVSDGAGHQATTNSRGEYLLLGLPAGTYTLTASKGGYTFSTLPPILLPPNATGQDFSALGNFACVFLPVIRR